MPAMAFFDTLAVLVSLLIFFTAGAVSQELEQQVTLWQFGKGRLFPGQVTLPMQPLGTLGDGSATTYLYQVVSEATVITTNAAGPTTQTIPSTASRTIVASASGWVGQFGGQQIACGFVNSGFGECFNGGGGSTVLANSGKPTPQAILIATPTSITTAPPSTSSSVVLPKKSSGGAIAGGVVAGCLVLLVGLAVCVLFRRRRRRQHQELENKFAACGYEPKPNNDNTNSNAAETERPHPFAVFTAGPQVESALDGRPTQHKWDHSASTQSQSSGGSMSHSRVTSASDLPTSDLVRILAERAQSDASEAPPAYPATPHFRPREKN